MAYYIISGSYHVISANHIMTRGVTVSEDLCWAIVQMAGVLEINTISGLMNVSQCQIFCILAWHCSAGKVSSSPDLQTLPQSQHLTPDDVAVSFILPHNPRSLTLHVVPTELPQQELWQLFGWIEGKPGGNTREISVIVNNMESIALEWVHFEKGAPSFSWELSLMFTHFTWLANESCNGTQCPEMSQICL